MSGSYLLVNSMTAVVSSSIPTTADLCAAVVSTSIAGHLAQLLAPHSPKKKIAVALSGGRDSVALLHCLASLQESYSFSLCAISIDHQLQPDSGQWLDFCQHFCARSGIEFLSAAVFVERASKKGLEAAARDARYAAIRQLAIDSQVDVVALGHHQDDQAETMLLQVTRGSGFAGLAAMPMFVIRQGLSWWRPMVHNVSRRDIDAYIQTHQLPFVEDPSNANPQFRRNVIRHQVLPLLEAVHPGMVAALAKLSLEAGQWQQLERHRAMQLWLQCAQLNSPPVSRLMKLPLAPLRLMASADQALVLRFWLEHLGLRMPTRARLAQMQVQLLTGSKQAKPQLLHEGYCFELNREADAAVATQVQQVEPQLHLAQAKKMIVWRPSTGDENGINPSWVKTGALTITPRRGGETIKLYPKRHSRSIKQWCQEMNISAEQREFMQVIWFKEQLLWVSGLGFDVRHCINQGPRLTPFLA